MGRETVNGLIWCWKAPICLNFAPWRLLNIWFQKQTEINDQSRDYYVIIDQSRNYYVSIDQSRDYYVIIDQSHNYYV